MTQLLNKDDTKLVGWLVGWLDGWMVGWLVGWMVGWLVGWLDGWLVGWLVDPLDRSQNDCSAAAGPETTSEKETENESDH